MNDDAAGNINRTLGKIEGAQDTHQKETAARFDRLEEIVRQGNRDAADSRRSLCQSFESFREESRKESTTLQVKMRTVELQVEHTNNQVKLAAPLTAVEELVASHETMKETHKTMNTTLEELKLAKASIIGAAQATTMWTKILWAILLFVGGAVGSWAFNAFHLVFGPLPPPPK